MRDALKNYLALASGVTEVGRQRALAASKALVAQGEATAEQVTGLAEDLIESSKQNRALVTSLVRTEIEKAMNRLGLATADEVQRLTRRLQSVEAALREASRTGPPATSAGHGRAAAKPATASRATAARPASPASAPKTSARKPATAKATAAKAAPARTSAAKTAKPATKPAAKKATTAKKAPAKAAKATARKATS